MDYPRDIAEHDAAQARSQFGRRKNHSYPGRDRRRRNSFSDDDYDDERPNHAEVIVSVQEVPSLSKDYHEDPNPFKARTHRGEMHHSHDRLFGQEAYVRYERPPTSHQMHSKLIDMRPEFEKGLKNKMSSNKTFKVPNADKLCGVRYGKDMAVATSLRAAITSKKKAECKMDKQDMDKFVSLARPLATDVEKWNRETYGGDHMQNLSCAEYGALDQHQRGVYGDRSPTHRDEGRHYHHRRRSLTGGRDKHLRDLFHDREEVSITIDIKDSTPSMACDPDDHPKRRYGPSTIGCNQILSDRHHITDTVRALESYHRPMRDEDRRRHYSRY